MNAERLDLLCVGYLADAQLLRVDRYPQANRRTTVDDRRKDRVDNPPAAYGLALLLRSISEPCGVSQ